MLYDTLYINEWTTLSTIYSRFWLVFAPVDSHVMAMLRHTRSSSQQNVPIQQTPSSPRTLKRNSKRFGHSNDISNRSYNDIKSYSAVTARPQGCEPRSALAEHVCDSADNMYGHRSCGIYSTLYAVVEARKTFRYCGMHDRHLERRLRR